MKRKNDFEQDFGYKRVKTERSKRKRDENHESSKRFRQTNEVQEALDKKDREIESMRLILEQLVGRIQQLDYQLVVERQNNTSFAHNRIIESY
jgi:hypothetical protein